MNLSDKYAEASKIMGMVYPHSNFYKKNSEEQRKWFQFCEDLRNYFTNRESVKNNAA